MQHCWCYKLWLTRIHIVFIKQLLLGKLIDVVRMVQTQQLCIIRRKVWTIPPIINWCQSGESVSLVTLNKPLCTEAQHHWHLRLVTKRPFFRPAVFLYWTIVHPTQVIIIITVCHGKPHRAHPHLTTLSINTSIKVLTLFTIQTLL